MNLEVIFVNDSRVAMAEGTCRNTHPEDCIDENPLGTEDVGVVILESFIYSEMDPTRRFSLCRWPLRNVTIDGISLREYVRRQIQIQKKLQTNMRLCKCQRKYETLVRPPPSTNECKRQRLLSK